ncbi:hypothetical protein FJTKL_11175 [Diaporthe vaccinii]|uniref:Uncharacterized protein n=1 Tax=Diaporthe vaccinii TaxID=105482 RepID=A0ABR4EIC3_9PEZI
MANKTRMDLRIQQSQHVAERYTRTVTAVTSYQVQASLLVFLGIHHLNFEEESHYRKSKDTQTPRSQGARPLRSIVIQVSPVCLSSV